MRYLLDTNIVSLLASPRPDPRAVAWIRQQLSTSLHVSVLVLGEIDKGIERLDAGARRDGLQSWSKFELPGYFQGRILPVDLATARRWALLDEAGRRMGRPLPVVDGLMLATAARHDLVLVTRNISDVAQRGHPVFDPFTGTLHD
jgi:predicted nucleic acid-binding protein